MYISGLTLSKQVPVTPEYSGGCALESAYLHGLANGSQGSHLPQALVLIWPPLQYAVAE